MSGFKPYVRTAAKLSNKLGETTILRRLQKHSIKWQIVNFLVIISIVPFPQNVDVIVP